MRGCGTTTFLPAQLQPILHVCAATYTVCWSWLTCTISVTKSGLAIAESFIDPTTVYVDFGCVARSASSPSSSPSSCAVPPTRDSENNYKRRVRWSAYTTWIRMYSNLADNTSRVLINVVDEDFRHISLDVTRLQLLSQPLDINISGHHRIIVLIIS